MTDHHARPAGTKQMGIDIPGLQLLCCAKSMGVDFSDTMTVGRQRISVSSKYIPAILSGIAIPPKEASTILEGQFAEPLFKVLGAKRVWSVDTSDWESATHVHDFNQPLPPSLADQYSVVLDAGTLEHVFNISQAFKNCMEMLRVGGHFIQANCANNYMGHGFWQFSPELIYRIFAPQNGFQIKAVLLHEPNRMLRDGASFGAWYKVEDPAAHHCRVELNNRRPTYICTIAQRIAERQIFSTFPQQSDYAEGWTKAQEPPPLPRTGSKMRQLIPNPIKKLYRWGLQVRKNWSAWDRPWYGSYYQRFERSYFQRISDKDLVRGCL
jgi:hypothetical protein